MKPSCFDKQRKLGAREKRKREKGKKGRRGRGDRITGSACERSHARGERGT